MTQYKFRIVRCVGGRRRVSGSWEEVISRRQERAAKEGGDLCSGDGIYLLPRSLRSLADAPECGAWGENGPLRLDDNPGKGVLRVALEGVGGDFRVVRGPVVGGKGDAPESGSGLEEFDADFGFTFGGGSEVNYADELLFEGFGVAEKNFLTDFDPHGHEDHGAVGADVGGVGVFGDVLFIGATGDDEDGETEEDALAAAAIVRGTLVGGEIGHGGDGLGIVLEKKRKRSRGGRY